MKLTLIHNPSAGKNGMGADELIELLEAQGHSVRYVEKTKRLEKELNRSTELIVVAGGDGTVGRVLKLAEDLGVPVAILPLGSANNIACVLGHMEPLEVVVERLATAVPRRFDIGRVKGPWGRERFVEAVGLGPLARALAAGDAAGVPGDGSVRFGRAAFRALLDETEPARLRVEVDGKLVGEDIAMVEVMNIGQIGPRLKLAPEADSGDGLLDIVCVPVEDCEAMLDWLDNPDSAPPPVTASRGGKVRIRSGGPTAVHVDDHFPEIKGDGPFEVEVELEPVTVKVLLPEEHASGRDRSGVTEQNR
jgi:diacylglycerol kinase (ATP)